MRILYVEDTLLNLCLVERIARMGKHEVINYAYAELALRNFERDHPDLALVDLRLEGDMNGVDLIKRLRAAGHDVPIVVITALFDDEIKKECFAAGADEYFNKPLPVRDLVKLLQRYTALKEGTPLPQAADLSFAPPVQVVPRVEIVPPIEAAPKIEAVPQLEGVSPGVVTQKPAPSGV